MPRSSASALFFIFVVLGFSCGGKEEPIEKAAPKILEFRASERSVDAGASVTIHWRTRHAESVRLSANGAPQDLGKESAAEGAIEVTLHETTEFRLEAVGAGKARSEPVTVEVEGPRILAFDASPELIDAGEEVTLSWETESATSVAITDAAGGAVDLGGQPAAAGSVVIAPEAATTYTLRAAAGERQVEREASVRIRGAPTLEVDAAPRQLAWGAPVTLSWTMEEGETLRIERDGTLLHESGEAEGSFVHEPPLSGSYVFTAARAGKTAVASVEVEVEPVIVSFTAADAPTPIGAPVELRWEVGGATSIVVSNGIDQAELEVASPDEGSLQMPLGPEGDFELLARSGALETTKRVQVPILTPPTIGSFEADRPILSAAPDAPAKATLRWSGVERAAELHLVGDTTGPIDVPPSEAAEVEVEIFEDTEFRLEAVNAAGEAQAIASVRLVPFPAITELAASPARVGSGESFSLRWATDDALTVSLEANGLPVPAIDPGELAGAVDLQVAADTTYVLRATNEAEDFVEESLTVTVGAPQILSFQATPSYAPAGGTVTFAWENLGGTSLRLEDAGGAALCSTLDLGAIASGDCDLPIADEGEFEYTLEVENGVGEVSVSSFTVITSAGPRLLAFSASPDNLSVGDTITFNWEVQDDPFGEAPTLGLTDGTTAYDLSDVDPNQGTKDFVISSEGELHFSFTASTAAGSKVAGFDATVHGLPEATLAASPSEYDGTAPVTLSWTSENADSLRLYQLDEFGTLMLPPLLEVPEAERAAGSHELHPDRASSYRIVATNGAGRTAEAEASVTMAPPTILSFEATPDEVVAGDEVSLSWTTRLADAVSLNILEGFIAEEIQAPFQDIRSLGASTVTMTLDCGDPIWSFDPIDEGCATIPFPAGFVFPFGGSDRSSIVMAANGFLAFSTFAFDTFVNEALDGTNTHAVIVPFWDDLVGSSSSFHHLFGSDADGQYLILQWSEISLFSNAATFSFQAWLRDDGSFEFRYGNGTGDQGRLDGNSATIGYQLPDGSESSMLHFGGSGTNQGDPMPGGLSGRSWRFSQPMIEPNGSLDITAPAEDLEVRLAAFGPGGEAEDELTITVHPRATLAVSAPNGEIEAGEDFTIGWSTSDADAVEVLDASGSVRCAAAPADIEAGACDLSEGTPGEYTYTVRATGALGHEVEEEVELTIYIPLSLDFQVSAETIDAGEDLTLSWATTGADTISLTANDVELLDGSESMAADSLLDQPQRATAYTFRVESADGRQIEATHEVQVRTFHFTLGADASEVTPGTPVAIAWNLTSLTGEAPALLYDWEMTEVTDGSAAFEDISGLGQAPLLGGGEDGQRADAPFPAGFQFPYYGETYDAIRVSADGWASFEPDAGSLAINQEIPISDGYRVVHLPVFWDDLHSQSGRVDAAFLPNPDRFIVQWTQVGRYYPTSRGYDLNFQLVLFPDGRFEYRYGTMAAPQTPATDLSDCNPLSCEEEVEGASATIGYQDPSGTRGSLLHFGGSDLSSDTPFPGGLANRSFRYAAPAGTSIVVEPTDPTEYEFCASLGGYTECQIVFIDAAWAIDDFTASSPSVDHGEDVTLSWETRGADDLSLTANGVPVDLGGLGFDEDSITLPIAEATTYELTLHSLGRETSAQVEVAVRKLELEVTGPTSRLFPGQSVVVDWTATPVGSGTPLVYLPLEETGAGPFVDISTHPDTVELIGSGKDTLVVDHDFTGGFTFPYFGEEQTSLRVSTDGFLSFATSTDTVSTNEAIPNDGSSERRVHIAAFWDDLATRSSGRVHALHASDGSYVFQWTGVSKYVGSSNSTEYDLNFQIALFPSGGFEIRYGDMDPPPTTDSSCHPTNDCVGDANGASATIGYQDPSGTSGHQVHFGGDTQSSGNTPFPGGLAHRSFRLDPSQASGSLQFSAGEISNLRLCAAIDEHLRCESLDFEVWRAGELLISEIMIDPAGGEAQWFELHNLTDAAVDLQGWEVWTNGGLHSIGQPLVVPPFGFVTFSAGPAAGFTADYELSGITLDPTGDALSIGKDGGAISEVIWDATWPFSAGQSLELDSPSHRPSNHPLDKASLFCTRTEVYDAGSNAGTPGWDGGSCAAGQPYVAYNYTDAEVFDIQATGTLLFTGIISTTSVDLGFAFPYFGSTTSKVWVVSSGFVTTTPGSDDYTNDELPSSGAPAIDGIIAPFWDDLFYSATSGSVRWEERVVGGLAVAIFDWNTVNHSSAGEPLSFQLQLWEDGRIVFAYRLIGGTNPLTSGSSATIGLQEPTASSPAYFLYSYNEASVTEGQVIEFVPVASP